MMDRTSQRVSLTPWLIVFSAVALMICGLAGIARGDALTGGPAYAPRQIVWVSVAVVGGFLASLAPYRRLKTLSVGLFALSLLLLVLVFFFPPVNGSRRWIPVGPFSIQPSELAKLGFVLAVSATLMHQRSQRRWRGLVWPLAMAAAPVVLILKEPDLGTSLLFFPVLLAMLFAAGARTSHLLLVMAAGMASGPVLWTVMSAEQRSRVTAVFSQTDSGAPDTGDGYHLHQSKLLLTLGGVRGSVLDGEPVDDPAAYRLPASRTDFVYCLVGERFGLLGTLTVLALFILLTGACLAAAARTRDPFGRLVATGFAALVATQALINSAMTVGLAPITGLTLPLMSYGGSSLVTTALGLGVVINIALHPGYDVAGQPFSNFDA